MSLTSPIPDAQGLAFTAAGQPCFFCGEPCHDPVIHWAGACGSIYLHPDCALRWTVRLLRDVHECENPAYYARRRPACS